MKKILFVCLGNICRSPAAEGILKELSQTKNQPLEIDSAGTSGHHEGELADSRMRTHAKQRGFELTSRSRPFSPQEDFEKFDLILAMDSSNYRNILARDPQGQYRDKVQMMTSYCHTHKVTDVPDPYYRGEDGFELVLDILEDACDHLLKKIEAEP